MTLGSTQPSKPNRSGSGNQGKRTTTQRKNTQPVKPSPKPKKDRRAVHNVIAVGMMIFGAFMLLGALVGWMGYSDGEVEYFARQTMTVEDYLAVQFELAVNDFTAGNYPLARERLDYVLSQRPDYQPAIDLMADVNQIMNITATPTSPPPTATPTATQDLRPVEDQYNNIVALLSAGQWDQALDAIANLRKLDPNYRVVDVDGLAYMALRNRGVDKILNRGDLEGGIYDFTLAENFGPLDGQAENYRTWARLYLLGNAFWGAYPEEAAYYYGQLVAAAPALTDASGVSAFYRYWASLLQQADNLAKEENWCEASAKYVHVLGTWDQAYVYPTATYAWKQCVTPTFTATVPVTPSATGGGATSTSTSTPTSTGSGAPPTSTFTPVPTATDTTVPTQTFTPTPTPTETPGG